MKEFFKRFSLLILICFSFFYTDKVINIINENDPVMKKIVSVKSDYDVLPVNAVTYDDTVVPGVKGKEINIDQSYDNMKLGGVFREESLVFNDLYPSSSIKENKDKYVIKGNGSKKQVAIIYVLNDSYIEEVKLLEDITIFINHKDVTVTNINFLVDKEIYTYGNNGVYDEEILTSDNTIINRISNNKSSCCLVKDKDNDVLKICSDNGMYTVLPNIIGGYYDVRNNLSNGSIILLDSLNDFDIIVKYIGSKGYDIVSLSELLSE